MSEDQGRLPIPRAGGRASSEGTSILFMYVLHNGRFWFSKSFLEGQRLTYWPNSHTMLIWGSGDSLLKKVSEPNCLKHRKMPLHKIEEIYRVQHEGQFSSLLPPWKKAEREAVFPSP